jgi:hypothetical protein
VTQKTITVPCPSSAPPPVKPDTVTIIRVDTVTIKLPPDTVQLPARVDTLWKHDTISTALPILPSGVAVDIPPSGELIVVWNTQKLGRLMIRTDGLVEAYRFNPAVTFGQQGYRSQGVYGTQVQAIAALMQPPPPGFAW